MEETFSHPRVGGGAHKVGGGLWNTLVFDNYNTDNYKIMLPRILKKTGLASRSQVEIISTRGTSQLKSSSS